MGAYRDALLREIDIINERYFNKKRGIEEPADGLFYSPSFFINTVFLGGGTPTVMPASFFYELFRALPPPAPDAEITVEANSGETLWALRDCGVNRLSIGLQAWQGRLLAGLGRVHTQEDFMATYESARRAGFGNINVDLMYALPGQSMEDWEETLDRVAALGPEHISAYSLTPEVSTPLWRRIQSGETTLPDEETDRRMYHLCRERLAGFGYSHYEISNFAKPGRECKHNLVYWTRKPYIGVGLGASSFFRGRRWRNTNDLDMYCANGFDFSGEEATELTHADAMAEAMFLGLRLIRGVDCAGFAHAYGAAIDDVYGKWIGRMEAEGLLEYGRANEALHLRLTAKGLDLYNYVAAGFL